MRKLRTMNEPLPYPLSKIREVAAREELDYRTLVKHLTGGHVRGGFTAERCKRAAEALKTPQAST